MRTEACAPKQLIAPGKDKPTNKDMKTLKKITKILKDTAEQGLHFVKLGLDTARIVLISDASFANTKDLRSQLGYLVLMVDANEDCNILHYASNRSKIISRSVMAAELFALVLGFDNAYVVRDLVEDLTGQRWASTH